MVNFLKQKQFIVIDEITMVDGATFDKILKIINFINSYRSDKGKCALQLVIVGDTMQLPPVNSISVYFL